MNKQNKFYINFLTLIPLIGILTYTFLKSNAYNMLGLITYVLFIYNYSTQKNFKIHSYTIYLLIFGIYLWFSDSFIAETKINLIEYFFKNKYFAGFCALNILENYVISKKQLDKTIKRILYIFLFAFIIIIIQQIYDNNFFTAGIQDLEMTEEGATQVRLLSIFTFTHHLDGIFYLITVIYLVVSHYLYIKKKSFIIAIIIVSIIAFAFIGKARTGMIGALPILFLPIVQSTSSFINSARKYFFIIGVLIILMYSFFSAIGIPLIDVFYDRVLEKNVENFEDKSAYTRILAIQAFMEHFPEKPIFGHGNTKWGKGSKEAWDTKLTNTLSGRSSQIHIGYLYLFYVYGIFGGILYILFAAKLARRLYLSAKITNYWGAVFGFSTLLLLNISAVNFDVFHAGLLLCIVFNKYYLDKQQTVSTA